MMICIECGYFNEAGAERCFKCGAFLVHLAQPPPPQEGRLFYLKDASRKVSLGQISIPDFEGVLLRLEKDIREIETGLESLEVPEDMRGEMDPEISAGREGLRLYEEALASFREYVAARNLSALNQGLDLAERANVKVNEALRINWESFLRWKEMTEDLLTQNPPM